MATFKEMESLAKESMEESDETIRKVYWSLPLFDACNYISIIKKLGRVVYV